MNLYPAYQTLCSIGFILLVAHTEAYQKENWPIGRVVYVHPVVLIAAYFVGTLTVMFLISGVRGTPYSQRLNRVMPRLAWALLFGGVVIMAVIFPGPYT